MLNLERIFITEDRRVSATVVGLMVGVLGSALALALVFAGPVMAFAGVIAVLVGLYLLTSLDAALIVSLAIVALLPYGTFPFKVGFTPSLLDGALGGFLIVYLFQWMTGKRRDFLMTPPSWFIIVFIGTVLFAFMLGLSHSPPTMNLLKTFAELLLAISMALILADVAGDILTLRRIVAVLILLGAVSALIGIVLWVLPDPTAATILSRLGRIGYPTSDILQYRENRVEILNERAIGTWVDPNAYSGFLMMMGGLAGAQLFSQTPVVRWRWLAAICFTVIGIALFLTDSRASFLGLATGLFVMALLRYRKLLWLMLFIGIIALFLPQTQQFIDRLYAGFTASDLETQMRLGEYKDALILIQRYPAFGVGFSGTPDIDLYVSFSSTYLILAAYMGVIGLAVYLVTMGGIIGWGLRGWKYIKMQEPLVDVWLGLLAGLLGAMVGGLFDHYYFNPQFQATATLLWSFAGLFLAATRLAVTKRKNDGTTETQRSTEKEWF